MAEMIATYPSSGTSPKPATATPVPEAPSPALTAGGGGYLNEVRSVTTLPSERSAIGDSQG